jgi:hypothetical protein
MTDKPDLPWDDSIAPPWRTVSIGPGWYGIVNSLDRDLRLRCPDYRVLQVKEKFGGLRFYATGLTEAGNKEVQYAEATAAKTCEECGQYGTLRDSGGWYRTLCDKDAES